LLSLSWRSFWNWWCNSLRLLMVLGLLHSWVLGILHFCYRL
jgi:hypothetical protein